MTWPGGPIVLETSWLKLNQFKWIQTWEGFRLLERWAGWSFQRYCLQREWLCSVSGHYVGTAQEAEAADWLKRLRPGINRGRSGTRNLRSGWKEPLSRAYNLSEAERKVRIVQELCESRGGRPGLSVLTSLLVSVDVKLYWTMLRHWSQLVPNMSTNIWGH